MADSPEHSPILAASAVDDAEIIVSLDLPLAGWRRNAMAVAAGAMLVLAIAVPLWAYHHVKIPFAPIVGDDMAATTGDAPVDISILANDADPISFVDPHSVELEQQAQHGTVLPNLETGVVTYAPDPGFTGEDRFTYRVRNLEGVLSNIGVVKVLVTPANPTR